MLEATTGDQITPALPHLGNTIPPSVQKQGEGAPTKEVKPRRSVSSNRKADAAMGAGLERVARSYEMIKE
jgi:hypothetical protein